MKRYLAFICENVGKIIVDICTSGSVERRRMWTNCCYICLSYDDYCVDVDPVVVNLSKMYSHVLLDCEFHSSSKNHLDPSKSLCFSNKKKQCKQICKTSKVIKKITKHDRAVLYSSAKSHNCYIRSSSKIKLSFKQIYRS